MGRISIGCANCGSDYPIVSSRLDGAELRILVERRCPVCSEKEHEHTPRCIKANCVGQVAGRYVAMVGGVLFLLEGGAWKTPERVVRERWVRLSAPELNIETGETARLICCYPEDCIVLPDCSGCDSAEGSWRWIIEEVPHV